MFWPFTIWRDSNPRACKQVLTFDLSTVLHPAFGMNCQSIVYLLRRLYSWFDPFLVCWMLCTCRLRRFDACRAPHGDNTRPRLLPSRSFLVADTQLYKPFSVGPSVGDKALFWGFPLLPTRPRLMLPCIRPCFTRKSLKIFLFCSWIFPKLLQTKSN